MSFEPTELQRRILETVHGLQHGKGRQDVHDGSVVVLGSEVPSVFIQAELAESGQQPLTNGRVEGALNELVTRQLLKGSYQDYQQDDWWRCGFKYRRPDGCVVEFRIDRDTGFREVYLDGEFLLDDFDPEYGGLPCGYVYYSITREGLAVLDAQKAPDEPAAKPEHTLDNIPPLVKEDESAWLDQDEAAKLIGLKVASLRSRRSDGKKANDDEGGYRGVDPSGRAWRKESKNSPSVFYLRSSLKSK